MYLPKGAKQVSGDGGKTFSNMHIPHGDNHDLWIDPDGGNRMILGNDGGATITSNGGRTWSTQYNQHTAQFYRVTTDNQFPCWVYGTEQDNTDRCMPNGGTGDTRRRTEWTPRGGRGRVVRGRCPRLQA